MSSFRNTSISRKLILALLGMSVAAVTLSSAVFLTYDWHTKRQAMRDDLSSLSQIIGNNSTAALSFNDPRTATEVLAALRARPHLELACIYSTQTVDHGRPFARYQKSGASLDCPSPPASFGVEFTHEQMSIADPIRLDGETIGILYIRKNLDELWNTLFVHLQAVVIVIISALALSFLAAALLQRVITRPILSLASTARDIAHTKDYSLRALQTGQDEVGQLIGHFNAMLAEIQNRDDEVIKAREQLQKQVQQTTGAYHELQQTMQRLKDTQNQLVQTEKMASLGGLVAGVAHEINTPVGVGVTAASTLKSRTEDLNASYESHTLTESALKSYIDIARQSSEIILSNLSRAAELIHSFKQVAVDQTSSDRRDFELATYLNEILLSLRPRLKKDQHIVKVECPAGIMVNSYPGALSQVLTNLVMNSIIHGFDTRPKGHITIRAHQEGENIHLHYEDDGVGIPAENKPLVFDPFFTTKRGFGGSGLGLHVVYNLITRTLGGQVSMDSTPGKGTFYDIIFPMQEGKRHGKQATF